MDEAAISRIVINRLVAAGAPREDAEDCAQEALIATWQAKAQDRVIADPVAWATTVARRRYIDVIRRERRQRTCLESTEHDRTAPSPEQSAVERAHARWLADCIRELPASTQLVCELAGAGQAQRDISERLEVSLRSAESHIARARRFLRGKAALVATVVLLRPWAWLREHSVAGGVAIGAVGTTAVVVLLPAEVDRKSVV